MLNHEDIQALALALRHAGRSTDMQTAHDGVELPLVMADVSLPEAYDLRKASSWIQVWQTNVHHYTRGELWISVDSDPAPLLDFNGNPVASYYAEIRAVGLVAGQRDVLMLGAANSQSGPLRFPLRPADTAFVQLSVEARMIVNGLPDSLTQSENLAVQVVGRLVR